MVIKEFFRRLASRFSAPAKVEEPAAEGTDAPPRDVSQAEQPAPVQPGPSAEETIRQLMEAITRQDRQIDRLVTELGALGDATDKLASAGRSQDDLADSLREALIRHEDRREEAAPALLDIAENVARQVQLLTDIREKIQFEKRDDQQLIATLRQLNDSLGKTADGVASQTEILEQIRARMGRANDQMTDILTAQGRRFTQLLLAIVLVLALLSGAILLHGLVAR